MIHFHCGECGASQSRSEIVAGMALPCSACRVPGVVPHASTAPDPVRREACADDAPLPERVGGWAGMHAGPSPAEPPGVGRSLGRLLLGLLLAVVGGLMLLCGGWDLPALVASRNWVEAPATIRSSAAVSDQATYRRRSGVTYTKSENHRTIIRYAFQVRGAEIVGSRPVFGVEATYSMLSDTTRAYPAGKKVAVWHDPDNPGDSTLSRSLSFSSCLLLLAGLGVAWTAFRLIASMVIGPFVGKDSLWSPSSLRCTWPDLIIIFPATAAAVLGLPILIGL